MKNIRKIFKNTKKGVVAGAIIASMLLAIGVGSAFAANNVKSERQKDNALSIALFDVGISKSDISDIEVELDDENHYEVEFTYNGKSYEYEIDKDSSEIIKREIDKNKKSNMEAEAKRRNLVKWEDILKTVSEDAGVSLEDLRYSELDLNEDDDRLVYEVEFKVAGKEYEYEVDAYTGEIVSRDKEVEKNRIINESSKNKSEHIGLEAAREIALKHAGVMASEVTFTDAELSEDDDKYYYEFEFYSASKDYEYDIHPVSGDILEYEIEEVDFDDKDDKDDRDDRNDNRDDDKNDDRDDMNDDDKNDNDDRDDDKDDDREVKQTTQQTTTKAPVVTTKATTQAPAPTTTKVQYISAQRAKEIATKHAGINIANAYFDDVEFDTDDGAVSWEIEFRVGRAEYEYDIDARTGAIIKFEHDVPKATTKATTQAPAPTQTTTQATTRATTQATTQAPVVTTKATTQAPAPTTVQEITAQRAKEIAARHAGINLANAYFEEVERDSDDGRLVWELEFYVGSMEYEYEIDARTGAILEFDSEYDD